MWVLVNQNVCWSLIMCLTCIGICYFFILQLCCLTIAQYSRYYSTLLWLTFGGGSRWHSDFILDNQGKEWLVLVNVHSIFFFNNYYTKLQSVLHEIIAMGLSNSQLVFRLHQLQYYFYIILNHWIKICIQCQN